MSIPSRLSSRLWIVVPVLALCFAAWLASARARRVDVITNLVATAVTADPKSPTGYAGGVRTLIAPGHNNESYQTIVQTQQMVAEGTWRLRVATYDNAPTGRPITSASPYRWWLASVGWFEHALTGQSLGLSIERAALWVDPLLQLVLLLAAVGVAWRWFGRLSAVMLSLGLVTLYPLAASFVPGAPDVRNLTSAALFFSVLTLAAGTIAAASDGTRARRLFLFSGVLGGIALWLGVVVVPVLVGVGLGGLLWASMQRRAETPVVLPWRAWGIAGAVTSLIAYLVEYAPAHLEVGALRLSDNHPLYALAWYAGAELVTRLDRSIRSKRMDARDLLVSAGALLAGLSVPVVLLARHSPGFMVRDTFASRLTLIDEGIDASSLWALIVRDGATIPVVATLLPLAFVAAAAWLAWRLERTDPRRAALAVLLVPLALAIGLACVRLSWWTQVDFLVVVVLVIAGSSGRAAPRSLIPAAAWAGGLLVVACAGFAALVPARFNAGDPAVTQVELQGLLERDLAQWLARRAGPDGAIVLAPPSVTASMFYHGGLRGIGSPYRDNEEGFRASIRLAGATSADEAHALAGQRKLTYVVIPSWDAYLDEYARLGASQPEHSLMGLLHHWLPPRWLRPVAFQLPNIHGFENQYVILFEVSDVQENGLALSRLAEYFLEMERLKLASEVCQALEQEFPADLGCLAARAQTEIARGDQTALATVLDAIEAQLGQGADEGLPWERRVSVCLVLAEGGRVASARKQLDRCLADMGETELRSLTSLPLYRFLTLCKVLHIQFQDPALARLAVDLLPLEMRTGL